MHLRNSERLQERVHIDLEAGMILKIVVACLGVGGAIFYLGLTLGQGDAIAKIRGVSDADGLRNLEDSLRSVAPAPEPVADGSLLLFPTLLSRRADQRVEQDELEHTLESFRSQNLVDQTTELSRFSDQVLRDRFGLALDPVTGDVVQWNPASQTGPAVPIPGGLQATGSARSAEAGEIPEPVEDAVIEIVEVPTPPAANVAPEPGKERRTLGKYTLQLQSFRDPEEARIFSDLMSERGYHPFVQKVNLGDKGL